VIASVAVSQSTSTVTSERALKAVRASFLGGLGPDIVRRLLEGAHLEPRPAQSMLLGVGGDTSCFIVVEGLARVYLRSVDGRQTTARYASVGEVVGLPALLVSDMEIEVSALTDVAVLRLDSDRFEQVAAAEAALGWACAKYIATQLAESNDTLGADIFQPIRARIARHLLDLAQPHPSLGLVVRVGHQYIANSIGSVREVVSRELRALARDGLIEQVSVGIRLVDPPGIKSVASAGRAAASASQIPRRASS